MAYTISLSNGNPVPGIGSTGLQDGTVDSGSTSLFLVGKNYPGYGKLLNENFVHLLENFANTTSPSAALPGQIWWDTGSSTVDVGTNVAADLKVLKVNVSTTTTPIWKSLTSIINAKPITDSTAGTVGTPKDIPYAPIIGDLWWDTTNKQLKLYSAVPTEGFGGWVTIGPANNTSSGQTGASVDTIVDSFSIPHVVVKFYISNTLVAILSKDTSFVPGTPIDGFSTVGPGFNLAAFTNDTPTYYGPSYVAENLLVNGVVVPASTFTRSDVVTTTTVPLITSNNDGVSIGTVSNLVANISNITGNGGIYHNGNNKDIVVYVTTNNVTTPIFKANGSLGLAEVYNQPTTNNGIANKFYVDNTISSSITTALGSNGTVLLKDGSTPIIGTLTPQANVAISLGDGTHWFNNIYGTNIYGTTFYGISMQAKYADLAERFEADAEYDSGTVVEMGGTAEITKVGEELSEAVFGVISTQAAYLMNAGSGTNATHPPVAISGRVPVKVIGKVKKGDRLVSAGNGVARSAKKSEITPWNVIGRALQNKTNDDVGLVEAIVKINS